MVSLVRISLTGGFLAVMWVPALSADLYLISRDLQGHFFASHRVFNEEKEGYRHVSFCEDDYWIKPYSVAWSKWEEKQGRTVNIEGNLGQGWKIACAMPTRQVSLSDVGIYVSLEDAMTTKQPEKHRANRFTAIRQTFSKTLDKNEPNSSFHNRLKLDTPEGATLTKKP
ncbi:hypothetical protein E1162_02455 [Rhodobacteraceae bacterium RKSG542]|uniref:hypothetical protein n=1 Tax=Pseudovibrio flavus TaxID=2529854 RepID=UPI0012BB5BAD|nr:hypothetical protein [Pseudovibrio flavus]MTI16096.1 hypothetical protein [Pseudovibrio flavus]